MYFILVLQLYQNYFSILLSNSSSKGKYEESLRLYRRAFEIAQDLGSTEVTEGTRVQYGIAVAHTILGGYTETMDQIIDKLNIQRLLDFKSSRINTFSDEAQVEEAELDADARMEETTGDAGSQESGAVESTGSGDGREEPESSEQNIPEGQSLRDATGGADSGVMSEGEELNQE